MSAYHETELRNVGYESRWTCPACYTDFAADRSGTYTCTKCASKVVCTRETTPVCVSRIDEPEEV